MSLVEFQEAQYFFAMATQFAFHLTRHTLTSNFSFNTSWFGFIQDETTAILLAVCGVLQLALSQATLVRSGLNSFYSLVLSLATLALSFATRIVAARILDLDSVTPDQCSIYSMASILYTNVEALLHQGHSAGRSRMHTNTFLLGWPFRDTASSPVSGYI
jgi:hypothetical protein